MKRAILFSFALFALQTLVAGEPVILLTGFEPFGGTKVNASWEAVRGFQGKTIAGHRVETIQLPVVYDAIEAPLKEAIAKFKPDAVICFGEGTKTVQIETVALNGYHAMKPRDNKGLPPPREKIVPDGKDSIRTGLPFDAISGAWRTPEFSPIVSENAGGYLCNECFYRLMSLQDAPALRGFIHVPVLGTKDPYSGAAYTLNELRRAVVTSIYTTFGKRLGSVLLLGDKYINGTQRTASQDRWAEMVVNRMCENGIGVSSPEHSFSYSFDCSLSGLHKQLETVKKQRYDYIFIQIGAADHQSGLAARNFSIADILKNLKEFEPSIVTVVSIPDFTATSWAKRNGFDSELSKKKFHEFNETLAKESGDAGALFVDITSATVDGANDKAMFADDEGLMYSAKMNEKWADRVYSALKEKKLVP